MKILLVFLKGRQFYQVIDEKEGESLLKVLLMFSKEVYLVVNQLQFHLNIFLMVSLLDHHREVPLRSLLQVPFQICLRPLVFLNLINLTYVYRAR